MPLARYRIAWSEPRWSRSPRYWSELKSTGLLSFKTWLRIYAIAGLIISVSLILIYRAQPNFHLPPQVFATPFIMPIYLALHVGLFALCPTRIRISPRHILISHGSSHGRIALDRVLSASLDTTDPSHSRLNLRYTTPRGNERSISLGLPSDLDLIALHDALKLT